MAEAQVVPAPAIPRTQSTSLYVGDLSPDVTEAILYETFNNIGPVASIRVCRDSVTRRSLGYAYVNFQSPQDAERALDTHNYAPILGRPCRIMWCQRDPSLRRSGVGNIFVKGLEKSIDHKELYDAFSVFGNISSCKILFDERGESQGRGFVQFETAQAAEDAVAQANGTLLKDKKITVSPFKNRKDRAEEASRTEQHFTNIFIKNLPEEFSDAQLQELFSRFGKITSLTIMRGKDNDANKSKGFGFVCFEATGDAKAAVDALNSTQVDGKPVYVGRAMKKNERAGMLRREHEKRRSDLAERSKGVNLYVKNLPETYTEAELRESFSAYGELTNAKVMLDERGQPRGFGFVCFKEQPDAARAVTEMNGRLVVNKPLYVALAQSKEERRQHLTQQHRNRVTSQRMQGMQGMFPSMYPSMMMPYRGYGQPQYGRFPPGPMMSRFPQGPYMVPQPFMRAGFNQGQAGPQGMRGSRQQYPNNRAPPVPNPNNRRNGAPAQARFNQQNVPRGNAPTEQPQAQSNMQALAASLASADAEHQKQILGDNLFQVISSFYPQQAGKLTGMLLQMDNGDLLHLLEDQVALRSEVDKAYSVLQQHTAQ